jgi:hypothetical protein
MKPINIICGKIESFKCLNRWYIQLPQLLKILIRMVKARRMRWAGHVARIGKRGMHIG